MKPALHDERAGGLLHELLGEGGHAVRTAPSGLVCSTAPWMVSMSARVDLMNANIIVVFESVNFSGPGNAKLLCARLATKL